MTAGLSGANRMHNTACRQRFLPFALNTCCSYCIISVEDLPTADNCDSLKWNPAKEESWYVCTTNKELCTSAMPEFWWQCDKQADGKDTSSFLFNYGWMRSHAFFSETVQLTLKAPLSLVKTVSSSCIIAEILYTFPVLLTERCRLTLLTLWRKRGRASVSAYSLSEIVWQSGWTKTHTQCIDMFICLLVSFGVYLIVWAELYPGWTDAFLCRHACKQRSLHVWVGLGSVCC